MRNIFLWVLQIGLAVHTVIGALWKFSHSAGETMPSLAAIPSGVWLALCVVELLCAVGLVLPAFKKSFLRAAVVAAILIVIEMLAFCFVHLSSGAAFGGSIIYWLVVAVIGCVIAVGRLAFVT